MHTAHLSLYGETWRSEDPQSHLRHYRQSSASIISKWIFLSAKHPVAVPYRVSTESTERKTDKGTIWACAKIQNKVDESVNTARKPFKKIHKKLDLPCAICLSQFHMSRGHF